MKKTLIIAILCISFIQQAIAERQINCYLVPTTSKIGYKEFTAALHRALTSKMDHDPSFVLVPKSKSKNNFSLEAILKKDVRYPEKHSIFTTITLPNGEYIQQTHLFDPYQRESRPTALINQLVSIMVTQLKAEAKINSSPKLAADMSKNINKVQTKKIQEKKEPLDVELMGKKAAPQNWKKAKEETYSNTLPIAKKKQKKESRVVMDLMNLPKPTTVDPEKYEPEPAKPKTHPLNPYLNAKDKAPEYLFPFPRLQNGGLAALILTPQLTELETKPGEVFSFATWSSITFENFDNQIGTSVYQFKGQYLQQKISLSTLLWQNINLNLETGYGMRDADIKFDALHATAAGGTTFLPTRTLDHGITDSTISLSWRTAIQKISLRPVIKVKLPTGSEDDLLSSGDTDFSVGLSANIPLNEWTLGLAVHMIAAGDLGTFDPAQGDLPATNYVSFQTALGRRLDYHGPLDFSMAYQFMQNPLRELSTMPETEEDIHYVAFLLNKPLQNNWTIETQASFGLSPSSASSTLSLGFNYSH